MLNDDTLEKTMKDIRLRNALSRHFFSYFSIAMFFVLFISYFSQLIAVTYDFPLLIKILILICDLFLFYLGFDYVFGLAKSKYIYAFDYQNMDQSFQHNFPRYCMLEQSGADFAVVHYWDSLPKSFIQFAYAKKVNLQGNCSIAIPLKIRDLAVVANIRFKHQLTHDGFRALLDGGSSDYSWLDLEDTLKQKLDGLILERQFETFDDAYDKIRELVSQNESLFTTEDTDLLSYKVNSINLG